MNLEESRKVAIDLMGESDAWILFSITEESDEPVSAFYIPKGLYVKLIGAIHMGVDVIVHHASAPRLVDVTWDPDLSIVRDPEEES